MVWPEFGYSYTFSEALERACHAIARSKANTSRLLAPIRSKKSGIASTKADQAVVEKQPSILPECLPAVLSQRKDLSTSKAQKPYDTAAASLKEENSKLRKRARDVESKLNILAEKHNHEIANLKQEHTQALRYAKQEHAKQLEKVQQKHKQALSLLEKVGSDEIAPSQERGKTGEASGEYSGSFEDLILAGTEPLMSLMYGKIMSLAKAYSELKREDNKINFVIDDQNSRMDKIIDELYKLNMNDRLDQERRQKIELIGRKLWEGGISGSNRGTNTEG
ncbi:hypothetical protein BKA63DRAFT_606447 [Paraphoma chrysanthemicola]|nr:hypothetical protein BKA63DRAFT_606447 [Paraphoma chrysanthemicola]